MTPSSNGQSQFQELKQWIGSGIDRIAAAPHVFVMCDYDGVLMPYNEMNECPDPTPEIVELVTATGNAKNISLALLTLRPLAFLEEFFPSPSLYLIGNGGIQVKSPKGSFSTIDEEAHRKGLEKAREASKAFLGANKVLALDDRGTSLLVYDSGEGEGAAEVIEQWQDLVNPLLPPDLFVWIGGAGYLELRPANASKGKAVKELLTRYAPKDALPVYVGDDVTDEEAFLTIGRNGVTVFVADKPTSTAARFRVPSCDYVLDLLRWLPKRSA